MTNYNAKRMNSHNQILKTKTKNQNSKDSKNTTKHTKKNTTKHTKTEHPKDKTEREKPRPGANNQNQE